MIEESQVVVQQVMAGEVGEGQHCQLIGIDRP